MSDSASPPPTATPPVVQNQQHIENNFNNASSNSPSPVASAPKPDLRLDISLSACPTQTTHAQHSPASTSSPSPSSPSSVGSLLTPSTDAFMSPIYPTTNSFHVPLKPSAPSYCSTPTSSQESQAPTPLPYPLTRRISLPDTSSPISPAAVGCLPDPKYRFPPPSAVASTIGPTRTVSRTVHSSAGPAATIAAGGRVTISHPYARLHARNSQDSGNSKRRRMWNHALEKSVFTPSELYVSSDLFF